MQRFFIVFTSVPAVSIIGRPPRNSATCFFCTRSSPAACSFILPLSITSKMRSGDMECSVARFGIARPPISMPFSVWQAAQFSSNSFIPGGGPNFGRPPLNSPPAETSAAPPPGFSA